MLIDLPILGICGWSGAGKTTLIESVIPSLRKRGWNIAVVKHSCHHFDVDRQGKDSDRFFRAGADVIGHFTNESFHHFHTHAQSEITHILITFAEQYDLVMVEGYKSVPIQNVWLHRFGETSIPSDLPHVICKLDFNSSRETRLLDLLDEWLPRQWMKPPVYGCVLIGGKSSRMGMPKHLLLHEDGSSWLERTMQMLSHVTPHIVIVGQGEIPEPVAGCIRLADAPDASGPMAGLLAAMRWNPRACWLVASCDLPLLTKDASDWLLSQRRPGCWAVLPRLRNRGNVEPLFAYYDFRARNLIESLAAQENYRLADLIVHAKVNTPSPPQRLESAWNNVNTPLEYNQAKTV
ncbi:MAG: molybdopterin-guanine dinucleotide biosynthesis protein B [Candidatus Omnitrophota bacterium]|nr:MAG: molybdopterin-guanine dinucleotide biosynthesis protein B [Candidatus Omnitrophota bacterium]